MLFDGAIRFGQQALDYITRGEIEEAHSKLLRAQDIVNELIFSLNLDLGEIAHNLQQLYTYINDLLVQANIKKDPAKCEKALQMLKELRSTWEEAVFNTK